MNKIKALLLSRRFWLVTVAGLVAIGGAWVSGTLDLNIVFETIKVWAIAVAGIGTIDKFAELSAK